MHAIVCVEKKKKYIYICICIHMCKGIKINKHIYVCICTYIYGVLWFVVRPRICSYILAGTAERPSALRLLTERLSVPPSLEVPYVLCH